MSDSEINFSTSDRLDCHRHTILAAYNELVAEGWIVGEERRTFKVSDEFPDSFLRSQKPDEKKGSKQIEFRLVREAFLGKKLGAKVGKKALPNEVVQTPKFSF